jgi:hypothetical protein
MRQHPIHIEAGDVPLAHAAKRLGLTEPAFRTALPELIERGFPEADPTTGNFDLQAIDEWRRQRYPRLFGVDDAPPDVTVSKRIRQAFQLG